MRFLAIILATLIAGTAQVADAQPTYGASIDVQGVGAFEIMEGDESPEIDFEFWARSSIEFDLGYLKWRDPSCSGVPLRSAEMMRGDGSCGYNLLLYGGHSDGFWIAPPSDAPAGTWNPLSVIKNDDISQVIRGSFYLQVRDDNCHIPNRRLRVQACTLAGGGVEACSPETTFNIIDDDYKEGREPEITYAGC